MVSVLGNESYVSPAKIIISKKSRVKETEVYENGGFPVQKIIGFYSGKEKAKYYRVQWMPTWVHEDCLTNCEQLIEEFFVEQNIIKDFRGEPRKVKVEKTSDDVDSNIKPVHNNLLAETVGVQSVFDNRFYENSERDPLSKKTLKFEDTVEKDNVPMNNLLNTSYNDSSDNEPLLKKKVEMENTVEHKATKISPKTGKKVTRARMSTGSPGSKTNSPISKTNTQSNSLLSTPVTPVTLQGVVKNIKTEPVDSAKVSGSSPRKKFTKRNYYKGVQYSLRSNSRVLDVSQESKNSPERSNKVPVTHKVYNTRQHVKHLTMNRKRNGTGTISRGSKKLPFSYKKMSPPQRKYWMRKDCVYGADRDGAVEKDLNTDTNIKEDMSTPISRSSPRGFTKAQTIMEVKKERLDFNEAAFCPEDNLSMQEAWIPAVESEPQSPEDLCTRFRDTWITYVRDEDVPYNKSLDNAASNISQIDGKLQSQRDLFSDESDVEVEGTFKCDVCQEMFQTSVLLHRHRFVHNAQKALTFEKHCKPGKVGVENQENHDDDGVGKWQVLSDNSCKQSPSDNLFSHHLRPRKGNKLLDKS